MAKIQRNEEAVARIVARLSQSWRKEAEKAIERLYGELEKGRKLIEAEKIIEKEFPALFKLPELPGALVEAAAYGYGIVPSVLASAQKDALAKELARPWTGDGMSLSERLHGTALEMREAIISTISNQLRRNAQWTAAARALYNGYGKGAVINPQEIAGYMRTVRTAARDAPDRDGILATQRKAFYNINRLAQNGAPNAALKAAYSQLLEAAKSGSESALRKAVQVAIEEKSRFAAERIMRTEAARAWADGFFAEALADGDVIGFQWKLSSRHPVFDVCDLYAKANMFDLGAGVFPKTQVPPLPAHPHCLCRLSEKYITELGPADEKDNVRAAGDKWLQKLTDDERRKVLGVEGNDAWQKQKADWRDYMRGWQGLENPETRLENAMRLNLLPPTDNFLATLAKERGLPYTVGKEGAERFYADIIAELYPPNQGFIDKTEVMSLAEEIIVDRYGGVYGRFVCPVGTPIPARSLSKYVDTSAANYHKYRIGNDIEVESGVVAPWFGQPGGGIQYRLPKDIKTLLAEGVLEEVFDDD
jgi:hypothetical protein